MNYVDVPIIETVDDRVDYKKWKVHFLGPRGQVLCDDPGKYSTGGIVTNNPRKVYCPRCLGKMAAIIGIIIPDADGVGKIGHKEGIWN